MAALLDTSLGAQDFVGGGSLYKSVTGKLVGGFTVFYILKVRPVYLSLYGIIYRG